MGRHKRMPSASARPLPTAVFDAATNAVVLVAEDPRSDHSGQRARKDQAPNVPDATKVSSELLIRLLAWKRREPATPEIHTTAVNLVAADPMTSFSACQQAVRWLTALFEHDALVNGTFDLSRAILPASIDRYLEASQSTRATRSQSTVKGRLDRYGYQVHPTLFAGKRPVRGRKSGPAPRTPYLPSQISSFYRRASALPAIFANRVVLILDLTLGAGARDDELLPIKGCDVKKVVFDSSELAVVTLRNRRTGDARHIPVCDPGRSARLLHRAALVGPDRPLVGSSRNAINVAIGVKGRALGINVDSLHATFLVELASRKLPTGLVIQLGDLHRSNSLTWIAEYLPKWNIEQTIVLMKEQAQ